MYHGACPTLEELGQFLDEQLEPPRQAEIGTHVDMCLSCQTVLETLTQRRAFDLIGLSTESLQGSQGPCAQDQNPTDEPEGIDDVRNGLPRPDTEPSAQLNGQSSLDPDRTKSYILPGETSTDQGSPGSDRAGRPACRSGPDRERSPAGPASDRLLRASRRARRRGHGRRLQGPAAGLESPGCREDDPPRPARRPRSTGPLPYRGRGSRPASSSQHRSDLRDRRGRTAHRSFPWSCSRGARSMTASRALPSRAGRPPSS